MAGAVRGKWVAHSAAQPESALLTYPNAASSARQVKSAFREGTRQETGLQRGKEQREDHLVGGAPESLQKVPCSGSSLDTHSLGTCGVEHPPTLRLQP
jgi:hypothetical protein